MIMALLIAAVMTIEVTGHIGSQQTAEMSSSLAMTFNDLGKAAAGSLIDTLAAQIGSTGSVTSPPSSLSGILVQPSLCGSAGCSWTAQLADGVNGGNAGSRAQVFNGGGMRVSQNVNVSKDVYGNVIANDLSYRLVLNLPTSTANPGNPLLVPLIAEVQLENTSPMAISVPTIRIDAGSADQSSVAFLDEICGTTGPADCPVVTSGATTTVVTMTSNCTWSGTGPSSPCKPVGDATPTPLPTAYSNLSTTDQSATRQY